MQKYELANKQIPDHRSFGVGPFILLDEAYADKIDEEPLIYQDEIDEDAHRHC